MVNFCNSVTFLQRVRIAGSASAVVARGDLSVCPSVRHIPVFCPEEWRHDRAVFSVR